MLVRSGEDNKLSFPYFSLSGTVLKVCDEVKYLGRYIYIYMMTCQMIETFTDSIV